VGARSILEREKYHMENSGIRLRVSFRTAHTAQGNMYIFYGKNSAMHLRVSFRAAGVLLIVALLHTVLLTRV